MWYRIDFTRLVAHLLPPILRSRFLTSLLGVMIAPLRYIHMKFGTLKDASDNRLGITGNVQYLEKALNEAFYLGNRQIHIETPEEEGTPAFYFASEAQSPNVMFLQSEGDGFVMTRKGEGRGVVNFTVKVPTFLCTSIESKEADRYHWGYLSIINSIIKTYKPAGRTFSIELYDYE